MKTNLPPPIVSLTILSTAATALLLGEKSRQKNNHFGYGRWLWEQSQQHLQLNDTPRLPDRMESVNTEFSYHNNTVNVSELFFPVLLSQPNPNNPPVVLWTPPPWGHVIHFLAWRRLLSYYQPKDRRYIAKNDGCSPRIALRSYLPSTLHPQHLLVSSLSTRFHRLSLHKPETLSCAWD